ncbi:hypothetical protein MLD38_002183 [Melastoma candidum]|uniref:Uncharacterized protein n=1 Tax=Melastoma candidum TaxID=119954 RepID=A0ACB9SFL7_9MYRT|nr:hypothetical protein MLD38_002183 [Melastoma candidum]
MIRLLPRRSFLSLLFQEIPLEMRGPAAEALHFEAKCSIQNPVFGCVGIISTLNEEIHGTGTELAILRARIAFLASGAQEGQKELGRDYSINNNQWTEQRANRQPVSLGPP